MDLSVFNLLLSTTPAGATPEAGFAGAAETNGAAQVMQSQDEVKTGDAFLKALEQARTGNTEKSAEAFFNTMSARANDSSALKSFKTGGKNTENVKVVKLHIQRTRSSEKMQRAQETAAANNASAQDRQKIPARENITVVQQTQTDVRQDKTIPAQQEDTLAFPPVVTGREEAPVENKPAFNDELTAADILINAAVQMQTARQTVTPVQAPEEKTDFGIAPEQAVKPETRTTGNEPAFDDGFTPVPETAGTEARQTADAPAGREVFAPQVEDKAPLPAEIKTQKVSHREKTETVEERDNVILFNPEEKQKDFSVFPVTKEHGHKTALNVKQSAVKETPVVQTASGSFGFAEKEDDFTTLSHKEARRQADDLAARLPTDVKIAVSVETNTPAVPHFKTAPVSFIKEAPAKKTVKDEDADATVLLSSETETPEERLSPRPVEVESDRPATVHTQAKEEAGQNLANTFAALPAAQKNVEAAVREAAGTERTLSVSNATAETNALPQHGQTFIPAGQELKGKAVSASSVPPKQTPVNELADQIKINIKKALKAGLDKIDIVLKPKELGTIKVHLEIDKDGNVKATLSSARADTLDLLRADLSGLKQALADSGFNMNDEAFTFNYRGERFEEEHKQHGRHRPDLSASDNEDESDTDVSGLYALNIRV